MAAAFGLATHLIERDPKEAATWLQRASDAYEGDLTTAPLMRLKRAWIEYKLGDRESALTHAEAVLRELDAQVDGPRINANAVRLEAMELAAAAAENLGRADTARSLREAIQQELGRQGAADRAHAIAQFNRAGDNDDQLLVAARGEFTTPADLRALALVTMSQAQQDRQRGNTAEAVALAQDALRTAYAAGDLWTAAGMHEELAELQARLPDAPRAEIAAHLLASAVIGLRAAHLLVALSPPDQLTRALMMLTLLLARHPDDPPRSYTKLTETLAAKAGLDLPTLLAGTERLPVLVDPERGGPRLPVGEDAPGDSVTDALTWATHWPPPAHLTDPNTHPQHWRAFADVLTTANANAAAAADRLRAVGWEALASALEQMTSGEALTGQLDAIDRAALIQIYHATTGPSP